jgi:hypothetical protein
MFWEVCVAESRRKTTSKTVGSITASSGGQVPYDEREKSIETGGCEMGSRLVSEQGGNRGRVMNM